MVMTKHVGLAFALAYVLFRARFCNDQWAKKWLQDHAWAQ